jgi:hypothetical protein
MRLEGTDKLKSNDFTGILTRNLPACSIALQTTTLQRTLSANKKKYSAHGKRYRNKEDYPVYNLHTVSCACERFCGLVVRVPGYITEMYCVSCEVRTEFIYVM